MTNNLKFWRFIYLILLFIVKSLDNSSERRHEEDLPLRK